jgi:HPr kinase/phosphorylase
LPVFSPTIPPARVQVIGQTEHEFLQGLPEGQLRERAERLLDKDTPCFIFARSLPPPPAFIEFAQPAGVPLLGTSLPTTRLISRLSHWLDNALAPRLTVHGVLVELFGVGVMITGKSGIGKSETALSLIKRGHRLIADDAVEIWRPAEDILVGRTPKVLANLIEVRGLGIIDVCSLYGAGVIRPDKRIELILDFVPWVEGAPYDRLGFDQKYREILGVNTPLLTVPVAPGRDLALIVETAAVNYRAKVPGV